VVRCRHFCWQQPWLPIRRNRPHGQRLGVSTHFGLGEGQVALAHVDGQRAVEHREDDAESTCVSLNPAGGRRRGDRIKLFAMQQLTVAK
jgi:hypothetical protein